MSSPSSLLRRILHIICSLWLALLLTLGITPAEAIHAFADHADTIHRNDEHGIVVEKEHHHCGFLQFQLMPFSAPMVFPLSRPYPVLVHGTFVPAQNERATQQAVSIKEGRGPPAAAFFI